MPPAITNAESGVKNYAFRPVDYDATPDPDAFPGGYEAACEDVRISKTTKDSFPMLILEWKLETALDADDENCAKSIGATATDFLTFFPVGDKRGNMTKKKLAQLGELFSFDPLTIVPKRITAKEAFDDLIAALRGQRTSIWVVPAKEEGRTNVQYIAPRDAGGGMADIPDDEEAPAIPVRGAKAPASKTQPTKSPKKGR